MSEESKKGIYHQSSFDAQNQNIPRRLWKIETTHRGVATHSLRTTALQVYQKRTKSTAGPAGLLQSLSLLTAALFLQM